MADETDPSRPSSQNDADQARLVREAEERRRYTKELATKIHAKEGEAFKRQAEIEHGETDPKRRELIAQKAAERKAAIDTQPNRVQPADHRNLVGDSIKALDADELRRRQQQEKPSAQRDDQRDARAGSAPATQPKQLGSERATPGQDGSNRQPTPEAQKAPPQVRDVTRGYSELQRTHEQVAAKQNAERGATGDSATAPLSKEQLQGMAERYAEARKAGNLEPTQAELRERSDMAKMQTASQEKLDRAHGTAPNAQQQERALLDHQHLAERLGTEARMIAQHLRKQGNPGAEAYEREGRSAFQTARVVHEQRQNLGAGVDRVRDAARVVRQGEQQKQSAAQEAARGGSSLTSEQRANASPDVKHSLDRKERAEAARATGTEGKFQNVRPEITKPGNARSGGRSR